LSARRVSYQLLASFKKDSYQPFTPSQEKQALQQSEEAKTTETMSRTSITSQLVLLLVFLGLSSTQAFVSPAIWSRIHSSLRLFGRHPVAEQQLAATRSSASTPFRRALTFGERMTALRATAPMSFGDFGGSHGSEELTFAEMREQLGTLESQLAGAMELGRYDEAKELVNEITTMKDFLEKQINGGGDGGGMLNTKAAPTASRNPFFDAFGLGGASPAAAAMMAPAQPPAFAPQPRRSNRPGLGAFGSAVGNRRRPAPSTGKSSGGLANREGWAGKGKSGDLPMEAVRKRHSDITAYGIRVEVFCFFQPGASKPQDNLYQFQCNIRITNTNPGDVQLLSRELKIFKADGSPPEYGPASQQLESQPTVGPGSVYMYMSEFGITCVPEDKKYLGRIEGHFNVLVNEENAVVKVPIAPFWLELPGDTLVLA
jgi:uncharacterized protein affecting Mg2+/Co2+ transport